MGMRMSQFIAACQGALEQYGDLEVCFEDDVVVDVDFWACEDGIHSTASGPVENPNEIVITVKSA